MFQESKRTLTMLVATVAVTLAWGTLSLSAPPPGKGKPPKEDGDTTPPAAVTDLDVVAIATTSSSITLTWSATADDGVDPDSGAASFYDVRYSTTPILNDADFDSAMKALCEPNPADPGLDEFVTVANLSRDTLYDFALKVADDAHAQLRPQG